MCPKKPLFIVTVRLTPLLALNKQAGLSLLDFCTLDSAEKFWHSIVLNETKVTCISGKKTTLSANYGTEAAEEPTKLLTVSMPLVMFKQAITQYSFSVLKFFRDFIIFLLIFYFFCPDVPKHFLYTPNMYLG